MNSRPGVTATADMAVLPGVLKCRTLRRTIQVRLGSNPAVPSELALLLFYPSKFRKYHKIHLGGLGEIRLTRMLSLDDDTIFPLPVVFSEFYYLGPTSQCLVRRAPQLTPNVTSSMKGGKFSPSGFCRDPSGKCVFCSKAG